jgi:hypothetical protein
MAPAEVAGAPEEEHGLVGWLNQEAEVECDERQVAYQQAAISGRLSADYTAE